MLFGFILGVLVAAWFILYGNGELLIQLGEQMKRTSDRFWAWQRERTLQK
jgi:hypothetical protein